MINIIMEFCNTKRELWEWQKNKNILKNNKKNNQLMNIKNANLNQR